MKHSLKTRVLSAALAVLMLIGLLPVAALAADTATASFVSATHDVFSRTTSTIAPGVTQDIVYAYAKDGKQMVYYVATADINRDDVAVYANYKDNQCAEFGMAKLTEQMAAAQKRNSTDTSAPNYNPYYTVVAGVNGDFYNMSTGRPSGAFVMEGTVVNASNNRPFFAIREDGTPVIGHGTANWNTYNAESPIVEAVGGSQVIVFDGKDVTANASGSYNLDRHCRTCVGITADGKIVLMSLDGRQEPFSCGGTMHELAQIMLEAGCVSAINLDGGGSTTFAARQEGENEVTVVNRPSDGSERAISSSLMIVSTAIPSDVFDRAVINVENDYVTPGSEVKLSAVGVSLTGSAAEIPENAIWQVSDPTMGIIENSTFVSSGKTGDAVVQLSVDGKVVGSATIHVVIPEEIRFSYTDIVVPYGKSIDFPMVATVNGGLNKVVLKEGDFRFELSDSALGTVSGSTFTACDENSGVTGGSVTAVFVHADSLTASATLTFGKGSTVAYDFEDGDVSGFSIKSGYFHKDKKYGRWGKGSFDLATAENGYVKNGQYSLAVTLDYSNFNNMGWKSVALSGFNVDLTDAIAVGFWMYIPKEAIGMVEIDLNNNVIVDDYVAALQDDDFEGGWFYIKTTDIGGLDGNLSNIYFYQQDGYDGAEDDANIMTEFTVYIDDITVDYSSAVDDRNAPSFDYIRASYGGLSDAVEINNQIITTNVVSATVRIRDDQAVDLSAVKVLLDGVELPASSYTVADTGIVTTNDLTLADGIHAFTFVACDMLGNETCVTRKLTVAADSENTTVVFKPQAVSADPVYIGSVQWFNLIATDIEKVERIETVIDLDNNSQWQLDYMEVAEGFTVKYSIEKTTNDAIITITKTGDVELTGEAVVVSLPIRTYEHINHLTYPNDVYVGCSTGDATQANSPHTIWKTDAMNDQEIIVSLKSGVLKSTEGTSSFYSQEYHVDTELNLHRFEAMTDAGKAIIDASYSYHIHNAVAVADKAATCTENGYTGRTVCAGCACAANAHVASEAVCGHDVDGCGSVVEWGTLIPAKGHTYEIIDGVLKCACGELYNGEKDGVTYVDGVAPNGWVEDSYYVNGVKTTGVALVDGYYNDFGEDGVCAGQVKYSGLFFDGEDYRFAVLGEVATGWRMISDVWYYFDETTGVALVGEHTINVDGVDVTFNFEETGKVSEEVWYTNASGNTYLYYGPSYYTRVWKEIDGKRYFFNWVGVLCKGVCGVQDSPHMPEIFYLFDLETGEMLDVVDGFMTYGGKTYYYHTYGKNAPAYGLWNIDGYYYYFSTSTGAMKTGTITVPAYVSNGLLDEARVFTFDATHGYAVDEDGNPLTTLDEPVEAYPKFVEKDGKTYYYKSASAMAFGFNCIDGKYYYFSTSTGAMKTGEITVPVYVSNGLLDEARTFTFDAAYGYAVDENGDPLISLN